MDYDQAAAESKRRELIEAALPAAPAGQALPAAALESVLDAFARVTAPEKPNIRIEFITITSLNSTPRAESRKPGNVVLNWRKLVEVVPDISLAGLGAATLPVAPAVAAVIASLYIWNKIWRGSVEEFSEIEAVTILALWQNRNAKNKIDEDLGFEKTNLLRAEYLMTPLTAGQYAAAVNRLAEIDCIELKDGVIWLREWVRVKYG